MDLEIYMTMEGSLQRLTRKKIQELTNQSENQGRGKTQFHKRAPLGGHKVGEMKL